MMKDFPHTMVTVMVYVCANMMMFAKSLVA